MKKLNPFYSVIMAFLLLAGTVDAQWSNDPMENTMVRDTNGMLIVAHVATAANGNTYISWYSATEGLQFDLAMQYFDVNGHKLWGENGIMVSTQPTDTWVTDYSLAVDNLGYAVISNQDMRDGHSNAFAWRISPEGDFEWGPDGLRLTNTADFNPSPQVEVTEENDFVFLYSNMPADTNQSSTIIVRKINTGGTWMFEITISGGDQSYFLPQQTILDDGSLMVGWASCYHGQDTVIGQENYIHYHLQKFSHDGFPLWLLPLPLDTGDVMIWGSLYPMMSLESDGEGGVYVMYQYFQDDYPAVMVNHVDANGNKLWGENGQPVAVNPGREFEDGTLCYNPDLGNAYVFLRELKYDPVNLQFCYAISGQKFAPDGERLWGDTAKHVVPFICSNDTTIFGPMVKPAGSQGNVMVYYKEYHEIQGTDTLVHTEILATLLDEDGNYAWPDEIIPVTNYPSYKLQYDLGDFSQGQWVLAWGDNRQNPDQMDNTGIFAQNLTLDGNLGPLSLPGALVSNTSSPACYPNPFDDIIKIAYELETSQEIIIQIIDIQGRILKEIDAGHQPAGSHVYEADASDLNPGIFFIRILSNQGRQISKIVKSGPTP